MNNKRGFSSLMVLFFLFLVGVVTILSILLLVFKKVRDDDATSAVSPVSESENMDVIREELNSTEIGSPDTELESLEMELDAL